MSEQDPSWMTPGVPAAVSQLMDPDGRPTCHSCCQARSKYKIMGMAHEAVTREPDGGEAITPPEWDLVPIFLCAKCAVHISVRLMELELA